MDGKGVDFVQGDHYWWSILAENAQGFFVSVAERFGGVDEVDEEIALFERGADGIHHSLVDGAVGFVNAGVSMKTTWASGVVRTPWICVRVVWGLSATMETFWPTRAFSSVDFPALGRPRIETKPDLCGIGVMRLLSDRCLPLLDSRGSVWICSGGLALLSFRRWRGLLF